MGGCHCSYPWETAGETDHGELGNSTWRGSWRVNGYRRGWLRIASLVEERAGALPFFLVIFSLQLQRYYAGSGALPPGVKVQT